MNKITTHLAFAYMLSSVNQMPQAETGLFSIRRK